MGDHAVVDLFVEDRAHEDLLGPLMSRMAREEEVEILIRPQTARGGHPRAVGEFRIYQRTGGSGGPEDRSADLLVVGIDGNCSTFAEARESLRRASIPEFVDRLVVACPDPHVERWYLTDPQSFESAVGYRPRVGPEKCARDHYKKILAESIRKAGQPSVLDGTDFASAIVDAMDLFRAGRNSSSLKAFLDDFRAGLRRFRRASHPESGDDAKGRGQSSP